MNPVVPMALIEPNRAVVGKDEGGTNDRQQYAGDDPGDDHIRPEVAREIRDRIDAVVERPQQGKHPGETEQRPDQAATAQRFGQFSPVTLPYTRMSASVPIVAR